VGIRGTPEASKAGSVKRWPPLPLSSSSSGQKNLPFARPSSVRAKSRLVPRQGMVSQCALHTYRQMRGVEFAGRSILISFPKLRI
jgi:hypothetical protein